MRNVLVNNNGFLPSSQYTAGVHVEDFTPIAVFYKILNEHVQGLSRLYIPTLPLRSSFSRNRPRQIVRSLSYNQETIFEFCA